MEKLPTLTPLRTGPSCGAPSSRPIWNRPPGIAINSALKDGGETVCPGEGVALAVAVAVGTGVGDFSLSVTVPDPVMYQTPTPPPINSTPTIAAISIVGTPDFFCAWTAPGMEALKGCCCP